MQPQSFHIEPLADALVRAVRESTSDERGVAARKVTAQDPRYPCRSCLKEAGLGAQVLLVSVNPFETDSPYAQRSPVFICVDCERAAETETMPEIVTSRRVNLRAFGSEETMLYRHSTIVEGREASAAIAAIFQDEAVEKVHIHTALHGCYLARAVRG